jgi:hypothetical protein
MLHTFSFILELRIFKYQKLIQGYPLFMHSSPSNVHGSGHEGFVYIIYINALTRGRGY